MELEKAEIDESIELETSEVEEPEVDIDDDSEVEEAELEVDDEPTEAEAEDEDDVVVSITGEAPDPEEEEEARAPDWVRDLRKEYRNEKRRAKELEQKIEQLERGSAPQAQPLGQKPTLEGADYDTERYETELTSWYEKKREHDENQNVVQSQQKAVQKEWDTKLESYHTSKTELKVKDYEFAEDVVQDNLSVMQQGMIVQGADNPALVVYALGKNPKKAKEIASKVTKRKASSKPEKKISGTGRPSGSVDNTLDRLRADAEKTGDFSKVLQYKKQKRSA